MSLDPVPQGSYTDRVEVFRDRYRGDEHIPENVFVVFPRISRPMMFRIEPKCLARNSPQALYDILSGDHALCGESIGPLLAGGFLSPSKLDFTFVHPTIGPEVLVRWTVDVFTQPKAVHCYMNEFEYADILVGSNPTELGNIAQLIKAYGRYIPG